MKKQRKIGIALIILGVILFIVGASVFSYRGEINPIVSGIGEYSFIAWLPIVILGFVVSRKK